MAKTNTELLSGFVSNITDKLENLLTLEIRTIVTDLEVVEVKASDGTKPAVQKVQPKAGTAAEGMISEIKLVEGDVKTYISKEFAGGAYQNLREFHMLKETQGQDIIRKNVEVIRSISKTLIGLNGGQTDQ